MGPDRPVSYCPEVLRNHPLLAGMWACSEYRKALQVKLASPKMEALASCLDSDCNLALQ